MTFIVIPTFWNQDLCQFHLLLPYVQIHQEEFAAIDYRVMRCAFDSQNELGRLCDEVIYQNDLAARLEMADGLGPVRKEVPVTVTYRDFVKTYWLDLIVGDAAIYELKTESRLAADHDAQLLNYLFLEGAHHGKLVNFRPAHVEWKFINTSLTEQTRKEFTLDVGRWSDLALGGEVIRTVLLEMLQDWGGFLELRLYVEALTHFLGGEEQVVRMVPLNRDGVSLGNQRFHMVSNDVAFRVTGLPEGVDQYERELQSLLGHCPLRAIQWINLGGHRIQFVTLTK